METFSIQSDCRVRCAVHAYVLFLGGPKSRREINVRARKACLMSVSAPGNGLWSTDGAARHPFSIGLYRHLIPSQRSNSRLKFNRKDDKPHRDLVLQLALSKYHRDRQKSLVPLALHRIVLLI